MRLDSSLNLMDFPVFTKSFFRLMWYGIQFAICQPLFGCLHSFFIFNDYVLCISFNSEVDFKFRLFFLNKRLTTSHQFPDARKFWVVRWVTLFLFSHLFPGARSSTLRCVLLLLLRLPRTFEYNLRQRECISIKVRFTSPCRCNLPAVSCKQLWHGIWFARTAVLCLVLGLN